MTKSTGKTDSLTSGDLDKIANLLDQRLAPLATKEELKDGLDGLENSLKTYIDEGIGTVMDGLDTLTERFVEKKNNVTK